jgi:hypothetical protein
VVGRLSGPLADPHILQLATSALPIQSIRPFVFAIDFPEKALKFGNFRFRDIWLHGIHGKMRPQLSLSLAVGVSLQASTYSCTTICHADIHHIELQDPWAIPVESINSSKPLWHRVDLRFRNPLSTGSYETKGSVLG